MRERNEKSDALFEKCRNILKKEKIPISKNITGPYINRRAKSWLGRCKKVGKEYEIEITAALLETEEKVIETTILHELLHTCPRCMNHGQMWKAYAGKINSTYGYEISTKTSFEKIGIKAPGKREEVKYMVVCTNCGQKYPRKRKCKLTEQTDAYRCGKCGGKLEIR